MKTILLKDEISRCGDVEELREHVLPMITSQREQWMLKMNEILAENHYSQTQFAKACDVSRVTVNKWCQGVIPRNRENFLKIGMAANYDIEKMNVLLQRYGRYSALYSKRLEDCVCMFILNNDYKTEKIERYYYILNKIKGNWAMGDFSDSKDVDTETFDEQVTNVQYEDALETFVIENTKVFWGSYRRFYAYVKMYIATNIDASQFTINKIADEQGWSSSLRQSVSAIRQNAWYPTRNKVISIGMHLCMTHEQIDELLELAHMEPLCAQNTFESVIMFVLDDAELNNILERESTYFDMGGLCNYAMDVFEELDIPETVLFISELSGADDDI